MVARERSQSRCASLAHRGQLTRGFEQRREGRCSKTATTGREPFRFESDQHSCLQRKRVLRGRGCLARLVGSKPGESSDPLAWGLRLTDRGSAGGRRSAFTTASLSLKAGGLIALAALSFWNNLNR